MGYIPFIAWRLAGHPKIQDLQQPALPCHMHLKMSKHPSQARVSFYTLASEYGAIDFHTALTQFITAHSYPSLSPAAIRQKASVLHLPFSTVPIFFKIKFWNKDPH